MKGKKPSAERSRNRFFVPILLAVVVAVLFWRSFLPDYVHFLNDAPLGVQNSAWTHVPQGFTGEWYDLNSIGSNAGEAALDIVTLIRWAFDPVTCAKFLMPIALWILGMSAWFFFRQLKFSPLATVLGGLAAMLASAFFSDACWGVVSHEIAIGMDFCALGLFVANSPQTPTLIRWARLALAGLAVGINVMEAADIGAILSVFVALFVFFKSVWEENGAVVLRIGHGIACVAIIAMFAGFIAAQTIITLFGTSITGISSAKEDAASKWDFATEWSLPKKETLGLFVPGLFGYRMDTPKDMMPALQDAYKAGNYWGGIGRTPAIDRYFDSGSQGSQPSGIMRFSGTGEYVGILVALIVAWAIAQSFRRQNSVFSIPERKFIWLGAIVLIGSLGLAWGRFAPFNLPLLYEWLYNNLPGLSTVRNPAKFLIVFSFMTVILFGYGVQGLSKLYLQPISTSSVPLKNWWSKIRGFDRRWTQFSIGVVIAGALAWLIYASEKPGFVAYLETVGFPDEGSMAGFAKQIADFSIGQVGWLILFFALSVGLVILIIAGFFAGKRARLGGILLGILLVVDLGRANLPWIIHWDYKQKYEIGSLNPVIKDFLLKEPYEHRVAQLPSPPGYELFGQLYGIEWIQHLFPYYNIQSLDKVQQPREPVDQEAFERMLEPNPLRFWQLTNTRYLLGAAGFIQAFDNQVDPEQKRFRIVTRFNIVPKPGVDVPYNISPEQYANYLQPDKQTAQISPDGQYALFDFTGALPRAKLYTNWETNSLTDTKNFTTNGLTTNELYVLGESDTNGFLTLKKLASPSFDPEKTVLLDSPLPEVNPDGATNENSGTVEFKSYAPADIILSANAVAPSILLLNDKYDSNWKAFVDGKSAPIFRANFIMRGIYLAPGAHTVEFRFKLSNRLFYVTLVATAVGFVLIGFLIFWQRKSTSSEKNNRK